MGVDLTKSHRAMDTRQHEGTYLGFIKFMIAMCVMSIMTLLAMALFLT